MRCAEAGLKVEGRSPGAWLDCGDEAHAGEAANILDFVIVFFRESLTRGGSGGVGGMSSVLLVRMEEEGGE